MWVHIHGGGRKKLTCGAGGRRALRCAQILHHQNKFRSIKKRMEAWAEILEIPVEFEGLWDPQM